MRKVKAGAGILGKKTAISVIIIALGCILLTEGLKWQIAPNIDAVSRLKAKSIVAALINRSVKEELGGMESSESFFIVQTGKDGKVQMVKADTALINRVVSSFAENLQQKYSAMEAQPAEISYGTLLGSKILSQTGFDIQIKILPLSVTSYDFETEFETQGINQTKYKVYIVLESSVRILQPFSDKNIKIRSKVLISEAVIVGDVPESYVNVPKEDILDVT